MQIPQLVDRTDVYRGKLITVHRDTLRRGEQTVEREVVDHPDSVAVVALDDHDRVLLVLQYRHPVGAPLWELPAGLLDSPDEDPREAARRELAEETGVTARDWSQLVALHPSPGMTGERVHIYLARGLEHGSAHPEADEELETEWVPLTDAVARVRAGEITNGLAVAGLLAAVS